MKIWGCECEIYQHTNSYICIRRCGRVWKRGYRGGDVSGFNGNLLTPKVTKRDPLPWKNMQDKLYYTSNPSCKTQISDIKIGVSISQCSGITGFVSQILDTSNKKYLQINQGALIYYNYPYIYFVLSPRYGVRQEKFFPNFGEIGMKSDYLFIHPEILKIDGLHNKSELFSFYNWIDYSKNYKGNECFFAYSSWTPKSDVLSKRDTLKLYSFQHIIHPSMCDMEFNFNLISLKGAFR